MSDPIILSDEEIIDETPVKVLTKKPRVASDLENISVIVLDDDPTPKSKSYYSSASMSFSSIVVPETPLSDALIRPNVPEVMDSVSCLIPKDLSGIMNSTSEMDNEGSRKDTELPDSTVGRAFKAGVSDEMWFSPSPLRFLQRKSFGPTNVLGGTSLVTTIAENFNDQNINVSVTREEERNVHSNNEIHQDELGESNAHEAGTGLQKDRKNKNGQGKIAKAVLKAQNKLQKAAEKAKTAELKKIESQKKKWESGKFALKSIVAEVDSKVLEQGAIGGHLLTKFSEKNLTYRVSSNAIEKCVIWKINIPEELSQLKLIESEVRYALLVYDAEEFCHLVLKNVLLDHIARVRSLFPSYTLCLLTNRLMAYINKRERAKYKRPDSDDPWTCPPIEETMAKLTTHYYKVHYRHCRDEAEVAEHVVGLTCSLASCQFRAKLSRFSVSANGSIIPKDCVDKNLIKNNLWLKVLVSIPKVQPRFAIAIWKKYPNLKSLLREYMNPTKPVYEKEFLLQDLTVEGLLGNERRVGAVCSKRVYRIIMAESGNILTNDVEDGADHFRPQET